MFIEQSSARIRLARTLFVLLGVLPCAGLCGWAAVRHSNVHREALERHCEQVIGLPLRIGSVEHVRPNVMRLHDCRLSSPSGTVVLVAPTIEVSFLDGQEDPFLELQNGFDTDGARYKVRLDYGVSAVDYRGGVTNAGA